MVVKELVEALQGRVLAGEDGLGREVRSGYTGDLLSCVIAGARAGAVWVTVQGHPNVVAVAALVGLAGIVVTEGGRTEESTLEKANQEGVPILATALSSFDVVSALASLGVRGGAC